MKNKSYTIAMKKSIDLIKSELKKVEGDIPGISKKIYDAFVLGRAAIVSKNYTLRDDQAKIIKVELSKVVGNKAAYYLSPAADKVTSGTTNASYLHALSEGYGLIFSLQFTQDASGNPYMSCLLYTSPSPRDS